MSRFLLLLLFLIWMAWRSESSKPAALSALDLGLFFGMYALVVVVLGMWSRLLAQRVRVSAFRRGFKHFHRVIFAAQVFIPVWFAVGVFFLGWGNAVQRMLGPVGAWPVQLPGAVIGTVPALFTWMGLWWSQYPADRALREQDLLLQLDEDLPIFRSPSLWSYAAQNLRLQILFTSVPILLILAAHDLLMLVLWRGLGVSVEGSAFEGLVTFASAIAVFITSPMVLWRILGARPMPPSPLRDRMEAMCKSHRLRFRDILYWPTHNRIANALVMGVAPRFRYVLMSDLLLSEMTDEQLEAVFAHELGHVVHRHMIWYLVFMKVLILALFFAAVLLEAAQRQWLKLPDWLPMDLLLTLAAFGGFLVAFGFVSRRFERQADVFAARTLERQLTPFITTIIQPSPSVAQHVPSHVGPLGASVFASALERVALINKMPIGSHRPWEGNLKQRASWVLERAGDLANNWLHGSIATRMRALQVMSTDPAHTQNFDRRMARLYVGLLVALFISGALGWIAKLLV